MDAVRREQIETTLVTRGGSQAEAETAQCST